MDGEALCQATLVVNPVEQEVISEAVLVPAYSDRWLTDSLHCVFPAHFPCLRHMNMYPLLRPSIKTNYHLNSFFMGVVPLWNDFPDEIVSLNSNLALKGT